MALDSEHLRIRRLLDVGRALTKELDQHIVLERVLEAARELTGARYAALGVLDEQHRELESFLTSGVDVETRRAIGELPRGRGVLGALIDQPEPLRLADVGEHPQSFGFPHGHPVMRSFLGVPVMIRGKAWGNLYLTEKADGQFTEADEEVTVILAEWAGIAIENAILFETSERRRLELERALNRIEATRDVSAAISAEHELEHVLELIVKRGRALVDARSLVIMLREEDDLVVRSSAGYVSDVHGVRLPIESSTSGEVLKGRKAERIADVPSRLRISPREFGVADPNTALLVPMIYRGKAFGVLAAFDRGQDGDTFTEEDEELLGTFAVAAATAVAMAQKVEVDRLRSSLAAAEAERGRWARELHDQTLQTLGALRVMLATGLSSSKPEGAIPTMRAAIRVIEDEIESLRAIITELRPAALDELGLAAAIEALLNRHREQSGFQLSGEIQLASLTDGPGAELQSAAYRLIQEALTNAAKHARAETVHVSVGHSGDELLIEIRDDGDGFDTDKVSQGFGLVGMQERVSLAGGTLRLSSGRQGTVIFASLPLSNPTGKLADLTADPRGS